VKPYHNVQPLLRFDKIDKRWKIEGSCFRLWSSKRFITASHCVKDAESAQLKVMNVLSDKDDLECKTIYRHPKADIAILEVQGEVPSQFGQFKLVEKDYSLGLQVHCFGMLADWEGSSHYAPARVIGGIIQRGLTYTDSLYSSSAMELSVPIPRGMSGGPAFIASKDDTVIGVAIGTLKSEIVVSGFEEYEKNGVKEKERISEITRYGVILNLFSVEDWLKEMLPKKD
jgi:hypothetical protein